MVVGSLPGRVRNPRTAAGSHHPVATNHRQRNREILHEATSRGRAARAVLSEAARNVPGTRSGPERSERSNVHASSVFEQHEYTAGAMAAKSSSGWSMHSFRDEGCDGEGVIGERGAEGSPRR